MTALFETRRQLLTAFGGLGLLAQVGRAATSTPTQRRCPYPPPSFAGDVIDVHSHISNATDLHVEGFLSKAAAGEMPDIARLLQLFAPILQAAGWAFAPGFAREKERLERISSLSLTGDAAIDRLTNEDWAEGQQKFEQGLAQELAKPSSEPFLSAYREYRARVLQAEFYRDAVSRQIAAFDVQALKTPEGIRQYAALERGFSGRQLFTFASNFFHYRYINAQHLFDTYGCKRGNVKRFVVHQLDYDYALAGGKATPTTLDQQVQLFELIAQKSGGRIVPFPAFDPWRMVVEGKAALDRVTRAIESKLCRGVKLYPPMGFAPYGNGLLHSDGWPSVPDFGKKLDANLDTLYDWCVNRNVPVLAHANPSWAAHPSFIQLGSPENWDLALQRHPKLRVCFAHFGGDTRMNDKNAWGRRFANLADKYDNAYLDCAFFERILDPADRPAFANDLSTFIAAVPPRVQEKLMYGSDWLLLAMQPHCDDYYDDFAQVARALTAQFTRLDERLFSVNATRFLG